MTDSKRRFDHFGAGEQFCDYHQLPGPYKDYIGNDWDGPGWYRVVGGAGTQISEHVITTRRDGVCGTHVGGWITGGHPSIPGENVVRKIQKYGSHNVDVTNCDGYMVYNLKGFGSCSYRYCTQ